MHFPLIEFCKWAWLLLTTSQKALHLLSITVITNVAWSGTHIAAHAGEGQELTAVISVFCVDLQQARIWGEVPEGVSFGIVCTVHLTCINKSCETKDCHQVSVQSVDNHISVGCAQNAVGNLRYRTKGRTSPLTYKKGHDVGESSMSDLNCRSSSEIRSDWLRQRITNLDNLHSIYYLELSSALTAVSLCSISSWL